MLFDKSNSSRLLLDISILLTLTNSSIPFKSEIFSPETKISPSYFIASSYEIKLLLASLLNLGVPEITLSTYAASIVISLPFIAIIFCIPLYEFVPLTAIQFPTLSVCANVGKPPVLNWALPLLFVILVIKTFIPIGVTYLGLTQNVNALSSVFDHPPLYWYSTPSSASSSEPNW